MNDFVYYVLLGLGAGVLSGTIGLGGGVIVVPALVFLFGLSQHVAQGTTLAMLVPPIGILAAWTYWKAGYVDIRIAALVAVGLFFGSYVGARLATHLPASLLGRIFGIFLLLLAIRMIMGR